MVWDTQEAALREYAYASLPN